MTTTQLAFDFDSKATPDDAGTPACQAVECEACVSSAGRAKPIGYRVRESARSRRVYLRVVPGEGLVVTVPRHFPRTDLPALVESRRPWIEKALAELAERTPEVYRCWPPEELMLMMIECRVVVRYCKPGERKVGARSGAPGSAGWHWQDAHTLICAIDTVQRERLAGYVAAALKHRARSVLPARLAALASRHSLRYERVVVRGQRSVWGSFSSSGTLSLNYKLLFLPAPLSDYVMLHELAHTRFLNHSPAFWALLETLVPGSRALDAQLADAGALVPPWLEIAR